MSIDKMLKLCLFCILMMFILLGYISNNKSQIENLNKQIELLECYKENYLIMADSIQNIHARCFSIGER